MLGSRRGGIWVLSAGILLAASVPVRPARVGSALPAARGACSATVVRYGIGGRMRLQNTPMNAGNGVYRVGPGRLDLAFEGAHGRPGAGPVQLRSYRLPMRFSYTVSVIGMRTTVAVRAISRAVPDGSGAVARGHVERGVLTWSGPVRGYRTAGTVTCSGAMCGRFGMPPPGATRFSDGPTAVHFKAFRFRLSDIGTFTMESAEVPRLSRLRATVAVSLAGRELVRKCERVP